MSNSSQLCVAAYCKLSLTGGGTSPVISYWQSSVGRGTPFKVLEEGGVIGLVFGSVDSDKFTLEVARELLAGDYDCLELSGVFALFILDAERNELLVMNDRIGVQSVFYVRTESEIHVSNHLGLLLHISKHSGNYDHEKLYEHLSFGYVVSRESTIYQGVMKLPSGSVGRFGDGGYAVESYWDPSLCANDALVAEAAPQIEGILKMAVAKPSSWDGLFLGLTAGKDSLCLASVCRRGDRDVMGGTFGRPDSADSVQGRELARDLGWRYSSGSVCENSDFRSISEKVAFDSGGLATCSYVDMAQFCLQSIPHGWGYVMGEGGECVRDFFTNSGESPIKVITNQYLTPFSYISKTLRRIPVLKESDYLNHWESEIREYLGTGLDADHLALEFYRKKRMPGNFSQRHSVLSAIRPKLSPFLDSDFIDRTWSLGVDVYHDSGLHREIVAASDAELLPYFDSPDSSMNSVQDWGGRFGLGIGSQILDCIESQGGESFLHLDSVRMLVESVSRENERPAYYVLRLLSLVLARNSKIREAQICGLTEMKLS